MIAVVRFQSGITGIVKLPIIGVSYTRIWVPIPGTNINVSAKFLLKNARGTLVFVEEVPVRFK